MTAAATLTITTPSEREVMMTRVFDAPRDLVFAALTKPELLKRWMEAPGRSLEICDVELRVGGAYRFVWRGPGRKDVGTRGVYREIAAPGRLVTSEWWEDWDAGETLATTVLVEQDGKTTLTISMLFPSREVRDTVLESGLRSGAEANYEKLAEVMARARDVAPSPPAQK
jgi:uncharacterized protein YndB with AHSA1/START domain